ncbi:hypothetical protein BS333_17435 [Vibrio azureus]|uniref:GAPS4 PD-(D/E)XK nuclease domain-containing protein n=1 Tax=Vibrio azureus NBRC 104587 TaxID=1219077 RepID=U3C0C0_9VIBR|nr:hypothetical protein [Vibrio azureus]AUI88142.1 hypothetical protein BS333_17435 [Vibrio azureus]GAD74964.1 hypothetical protein VAZ01S_017_00590 [Vibrio azureus NBRC 104587]
MAGERSKTIGEVGESIAENFFSKIGWGLPQKGIYYPCIKRQKHALSTSKSGEKTQHGIDFQFSYKSLLESETLNHLIISVKHAKDSKYPASATAKFKGYIQDLVHTRECFLRSGERRELNVDYKGCKRINDIPVLFYISSCDHEDFDFVSKLQSSRFMNDYDIGELYIVDNRRVSFILNVLTYIESKHSDWDWNFFNPLTGMNIADSTIMQHNKKMQVEFLNSPFVPFLLKKTVGGHETCKFLVASIDGFSANNFAKLITYCRQNTNDNVSDVEIVTGDYFPDDHDSIIRKVLSSNEMELNVSLGNFKPNFRSLANV